MLERVDDCRGFTFHGLRHTFSNAMLKAFSGDTSSRKGISADTLTERTSDATRLAREATLEKARNLLKGFEDGK